MRKPFLVLVIFFATALSIAGFQKVYASSFSYYRTIIIDHTKVGTVNNTDQTNFPVLVSLSNSALRSVGNGGHVQHASGYDIMFYSDVTLSTRLAAEREFYDATTGTYIAWVKVPSLSHTVDTVIYMGYGDAAISTDPNVDATYGATSVWDSNFRLVQHHPDGSTLSVLDSTSNGFNGTITGSVAAATGKIDGAGSYDGSTGYVTATTYTSNSTSATFSAWIKPTTVNASHIIMSNAAGLSAPYFELRGDAHLGCGPAANNNPTITNESITAGVWTHVVCTIIFGANRIYINGAEATYSDTGGVGGYTNGFTGIRIGAYQDGSLKMLGSIDDPRVSNSVRAPDWVKTEYNNQSDPGNIGTPGFYSVGSESDIDNTLPTITNVSSDKTDGTYTTGEIIDIDVTFSETVTSTGNVTVTLETGTTDQTCTFTVTSATTGTCDYTVQAGDMSSDLTVSSISGTIVDGASNVMSSFTPATNLAANKAIVIDTTVAEETPPASFSGGRRRVPPLPPAPILPSPTAEPEEPGFVPPPAPEPITPPAPSEEEPEPEFNIADYIPDAPEIPDIVTPVRNISSDIGSSFTSGVRNFGSLMKTSGEDIARISKILFSTIEAQDKKVIFASAFGTVAVAPVALVTQYSLASNGLLVHMNGFSDVWFVILGFIHSVLSSLGLRKKYRYWGTVYDSVTKQPIDPAFIELFDVDSNKVVGTSITDFSGRFGFLDRPGKFIIRAKKTHYSFPSRNITGPIDGIFNNLYHGEVISIGAEGSVLSPNIPMDPEGYDWNQEAKKSMIQFHPKVESFVNIVLQLLFWSGFALSVVLLVSNPNILNIIFSALYLGLVFLRKFIPSTQLWGRVTGPTNAIANLYLELSPKALPNMALFKTTTSESGRFFLKAPKGEYILNIKRIEGDHVNIVKTLPVIVRNEGVFNEEVSLS